MKSELENAYLDTTYQVSIDGLLFDINIGKKLPDKIEQILFKEKFAVILTACNPRSEQLSLSENKARHNKLVSQLKNKKLFKAVGRGNNSNWPEEQSVLILAMQQQEAMVLALEFEQYAFVYCESKKLPQLVFTNIWSSS